MKSIASGPTDYLTKNLCLSLIFVYFNLKKYLIVLKSTYWYCCMRNKKFSKKVAPFTLAGIGYKCFFKGN